MQVSMEHLRWQRCSFSSLPFPSSSVFPANSQEKSLSSNKTFRPGGGEGREKVLFLCVRINYDRMTKLSLKKFYFLSFFKINEVVRLVQPHHLL